ncbi:MAG TPA: PilZ domain-containing protein [Thermoanaerobaculia bacterium]|nr:PilZ domain-containing protein [Thermoanaerobaculia bacterium]
MNRAERRGKMRIQLTHGIIARFGATPAVIVDITDAGARIEHFAGLEVGRRGRFRLSWRDTPVEVEATVVRCRVQRFGTGKEGTTVFESGLSFTSYCEDSMRALHDLVATQVARSLAEQVANARGIGPVIERNMPVFRSGVVETAADRGYLRCTLYGGRWDKKWSRSPDQPDEGFTLLASEPEDHIKELCAQYLKADAEDRQFIKALARITVERDNV